MSFRKIIYFLVSVFLLFFFFYLIQPVKDFPVPPYPSLQSGEPADVEDPLRRSYFLNHDRQSVIDHYKKELAYMPILRLNYPPEDAQTVIRDQTRSSYLEELTQPFRVSLYVNGFVPKEAKDRILIQNQSFEQKITVRYVPTDIQTRLAFFVVTSASTYLLIWTIFSLFEEVKKLWQKKK